MFYSGTLICSFAQPWVEVRLILKDLEYGAPKTHWGLFMLRPFKSQPDKVLNLWNFYFGGYWYWQESLGYEKGMAKPCAE